MHTPRMPDFFEDSDPIVDAPDSWEGGRVRHTGGNIWCREWRRTLPGGREVSVVYNDSETGIGVSHYPDRDDNGVDECVGGVVSNNPTAGGGLHSDENYAETAVVLMRVINLALDDH